MCEIKTNNIIRIYKPEEMEAINCITGKKMGDRLSYEELEFVNKFDLFDEPIVKIARIIWKYRNNKKALEQLKSIFFKNEINEFNGVLEVLANEN